MRNWLRALFVAAACILPTASAPAWWQSIQQTSSGSAPVCCEPEANAIFAAFTTPPSPTDQTNINNAVFCLKANSVWATLTSLQVYAAADSQAARVDWANVTRVATLTLTPTFTAYRGFTTDGVSNAIDTLVNPTTSVGSNGTTAAMAQNALIMAGWSLTSTQFAASSFGWFTTQGITINPRNASDQAVYRANTSPAVTIAGQLNGSGMYVTVRSGANAQALDRNGASIGSDAGTSVAPVNATLGVGRTGTVSFVAGQFAMFAAGTVQSGTIRTAFYGCMRPYMTAVGVP